MLFPILVFAPLSRHSPLGARVIRVRVFLLSGVLQFPGRPYAVGLGTRRARLPDRPEGLDASSRLLESSGWLWSPEHRPRMPFQVLRRRTLVRTIREYRKSQSVILVQRFLHARPNG